MSAEENKKVVLSFFENFTALAYGKWRMAYGSFALLFLWRKRSCHKP